MNILIDIGHPAHVHNYRNLAIELENNNHKIVWTVKNIPVAKKLLDFYGFRYVVFPRKKDKLLGKIFMQFRYGWLLYKICKKERIDIAIGTSVTISHVSKISRIKSIVFDDDDDHVQPLATRFVNPFADFILSPDALKKKRKRHDTIYYAGYHELAYLHPKRFKPDPTVLKLAGLKDTESFFIMRFNVFKAHHDLGINGLTLEQKLKLINVLSPYGKVLITTEREIEPELKKFQLKIAPEKIHSLMAFATIFLGDSQTMTSEAAVLGVPALKCNSFAGRLSVANELEEKYGLNYAYLPHEFDSMIEKLRMLLNIPDLKKIWQQKRNKMLSDKIDVTAFWVWFIENYPKSVDIMCDNTEYHDRFR